MQHPDPRHLGHAVKLARTARGTTQRALAVAVGLAPAHLSRIEAGTRPLSADRLKAIADSLGYSLDELVGLPERAAPQGDR